MNGITIIIPTHNGQKVIEMALEGIFKQSNHIPIEVIIINNNSTDRTIELAHAFWQKNKRVNLDFKILNEENPGKFNAQHLGILSSNYNVVLICDDDNILNKQYCQIALDWFNKNPEIAAIGGAGIPLFESKEPPWFKTYHEFYAVGSQGAFAGDITNQKGCLYGAGMVIRKDIYLDLFKRGFEPIFTSRKGKNLASGSEDTELCYAFRLMGYKIFYDDALTFQHFIDKRKLTKAYVLNLVLSQAKASGKGLVYQSIMQNKSFLTLWIENFNAIFSFQFYKYLVFLLTNYKNMRLKAIYYFVSFLILLKLDYFSFKYKLKKINQIFQ
jgi:glycosyltransferase involved in cell wall biosynthesis